jgi:hypothetical protein
MLKNVNNLMLNALVECTKMNIYSPDRERLKGTWRENCHVVNFKIRDRRHIAGHFSVVTAYFSIDQDIEHGHLICPEV